MKSRTLSGIQNSKATLLYYVANLIVSFLSRKVFIDCLGTEILGLNTTLQNLLNVLNLSELGIGTAVAYTLYRPLHLKDNASVNEIMTLQAWFYRRVARVIWGGSLVLMLVFPFLFSKSDISLGYVYIAFLVFLYSSLQTYYFNYKQTLLIANQQQYEVVYHYQFVFLVKNIVQVFFVLLFPHPYLWWLFIHVVFVTLATWRLDKAVRRVFPYLDINVKRGKELSYNYPHLIAKVKQVFFHRIATFALTNSSPLIIYAYTTLTIVTFYESYMLVILAIQALVNALFSGVYAGVGNLVAEGDKLRIMQVFRELFSVRFFLACICCYGVMELMEPLISLWLGKEYLLPWTTLYLMIGILYISLSRQAVETYIAAHGMYQDIVAPIIESVLNIGLSCWMGYMWGMDGILAGVLISLIAVVLCWKPYFLFKYGLKKKLSVYLWMYGVHLACMFFAYVVTDWTFRQISLSWVDGEVTMFIAGLIRVFTFSAFLFILLWLFTSGMKHFCVRMKNNL